MTKDKHIHIRATEETRNKINVIKQYFECRDITDTIEFMIEEVYEEIKNDI